MPDSPILFPKPCSQAWEAMTEEGRARRCAQCDCPVHDLSRYTPEEMLALIAATDKPICGRAQLLPDGSIVSRRSAAGLLLTAVTVFAAVTPLTTPAWASDALTGIRGTINPGHTMYYGNPGAVHEATVTVSGEGIRQTTKTDQQGKFVFEDLKPGTYNLNIETARKYSFSVDAVLVCPQIMTVRDIFDPDLQPIIMGTMVPHVFGEKPVPRGYMRDGETGIGGGVHTPDGLALPGLKVTVTPLDRNPSSSLVVTTDSSGSYHFNTLQPGDYSLTISGPGLVTLTVPHARVLDGYRLVVSREICAPSTQE